MPSISPSLRKIRDISDSCLQELEKQSVPLLDSLNIWLRLMVLKQLAGRASADKNEKIFLLDLWRSLKGAPPDGIVDEDVQPEPGFAPNSDLYRILTDTTKYNPDELSRFRNLKTAISLIDATDLNLKELGELGLVVDHILDERARSHPEIGKHWIPSSIIRLMIEITDSELSSKIYYPFSGLGRFWGEFSRSSIPENDSEFYAQEPDSSIYDLAVLFSTLGGDKRIKLNPHDPIEQPLTDEKGNLQKFDLIYSVLPVSGGYWGIETAKYDRYERFPYGLPHSKGGDWAYIQHILASLSHEGYAAIVVPVNALYREKDFQIRQGIVESGKLDKMILLPDNLFYHTRLPTVLLYFTNFYTGNIVTFIDVSNMGKKFRTMTVMSDDDVSKIATLFFFSESAGKDRRREVLTDELKEKNYNLNPLSYLIKNETQPDIDEVRNEIRYWDVQMTKAMRAVDFLFEKMGIEVKDIDE